MDSLGPNPFAVLTFIVAPAVLTNAATVMGLQTSNRFARAIDRARALSALLDGLAGRQDPEARLRLRQLESAQRRALLLVRALSAFYLSVGSFAAASFASLLGAICAVAGLEVLRHVCLGLALVSGALGVGGVLVGSGLVVWETRQSLAILGEEVTWVRQRRAGRLREETPESPPS